MSDPYPGFPRSSSYRTIICDPPWRYSNGPAGSLRVTPYPTLSDDAIFNLPVGEAAATDCLLLFWTSVTLQPISKAKRRAML